jgi:hypothetical protein
MASSEIDDNHFGGSTGRWLQLRVLIDDEQPWFKELVRLAGDFGFGLTVIKDVLTKRRLFDLLLATFRRKIPSPN